MTGGVVVAIILLAGGLLLVGVGLLLDAVDRPRR
jgi:hypothetical protein